MANELFYKLSNIGILSSVLPLLMLIALMYKAHHKLWWVLFISVFPWSVAETLNWILASYGYNTIIIFNIFDIVSTLAYGVLYIYLTDNKQIKTIILGLVLAHFILSTSYFTFYSSWNQPSSIISILTTSLPILFSIYYFYYLLSQLTIPSLFKNPIYWINSAVIIYHGMSFFAYISLGYIIDHDLGNFNTIWAVMILSNVIHNILYTIGIWQLKRV